MKKRASLVDDRSSADRLRVSRSSELEYVLVVEPCEVVREVIVRELCALGYVATGTASLTEARGLVRTGAFGTLVIHTSEFPASGLTLLARVMVEQPRVALIARVSVASGVGVVRFLGRDGKYGVALEQFPCWRHGIKWLRLSSPDQLDDGLSAVAN
jgi:hypothetical protein